MTIKKLSQDKVRITLSHEELAAYEIDWDHLGPDDEPTRELLLQLLDSAWQTAGFRPDEGQIYIDELEHRLAQVTGRKISISQGKGKGRITIEYYGNEDLESLTQVICSMKKQ